ncbi:hypothetical protein BGZ54_010042 [Gamsiella multidivaricata]|nr:hypothetical protein BGZ54_010042 [Gamsiella multidivaricata]
MSRPEVANELPQNTDLTRPASDPLLSPGPSTHEYAAHPHEQDGAVSPLFENVVFYLNPFLEKERLAELDSLLCEHGASRSRLLSTEDSDEGQNSIANPTHIITDDLDLPDYKHAAARGIQIVKLPQIDRQLIRDAVEDYGGLYTSQITSDVTHMLAITPEGEKYDYIMAHPELEIKVVLPHWFQLCCNLKRVMPEAPYEFPSPPMYDPDYAWQEPPTGFAPQLYSNSLKPVTAFLQTPNDPSNRFLEGLHILLGDDLAFIFPERRAKLEEKIEAAGGILANEYSGDIVDILICRYRSGTAYIGASRDGKIVGSVDWLLHVLQTGTLPSPKAWLLHYPIPQGSIEGSSSLVITISNYTGPVREYLKRMIVAIGAIYKPTLSSSESPEPTTHIICGNASGDKYEKGHEWNVKIVNHLWLEECFQAWTLQSETKPRYMLFPSPNQLSLVFGAKLLPESVEDWINIAEDEEIAKSGVKANGDIETSPSTSKDNADPSKSVQQEQKQVSFTFGEAWSGPSSPVTSKAAYIKSSGDPKQPTSDISTPATSAPSSPTISHSTESPDYISVRGTSKKRGAALQASKALRKIVPDMNEFQEELRDEKKASKKKKKQVVMDMPKDDESMDVDVDEAAAVPSSTKKVGNSPTKRRRISMGSVDERSTPAGSGDDEDQELEANTSSPRMPSKKPRRAAKSEKNKDREDSAMDTSGTVEQGAGAAAGKLKRVRYITTGVKEQSAAQAKALKALGIMPTTAVEKCTHLVATSIARTGKFLIALLQGKAIVHEDWLQACIDANAILDEDDFRIKDSTNEQKLGMDLYESLDRAREKRVFENCVFYLSPSIKQDMPGLKSVVEAGGGKASTLLHTGLGFLRDRLVKSSKTKTGTTPGVTKGRGGSRKKDHDGGHSSHSDGDDGEDPREKEGIVAVVSSDKDKDMWQPILDAGAHIYSHDLISISVLTQRLDLGKTHALA